MPIIAKSNGGGDFEMPQPGIYCAVCSDVKDLGINTTQFGEKHQARITWQLDERSPTTGRRFQVSSIFALSLHKKSRLAVIIESWLAKSFNDDERYNGINLEELVGKVCQVTVTHNVDQQGRTWANANTVVPAPRGFSMEIESTGGDTPF